MAIINILPNGTTSGNPNYAGNPEPPKRSVTAGWNFQVSRRLRKWFYSVDTTALTGVGIAFTLTVRDCPESSDDWHQLRQAFHKRLKRMGLIRMQWLTEWQARGVPHLHGIAYFPEWIPPTLLVNHWLKLTSKKYQSMAFGQNAKPVETVLGWLDYLAKHSTRSAAHYQRSPENIPQGWQTTGRMWGKYGDWPIRDPMQFQVCQEGFYAFRRIANQLRHSKVRERLQKARRAVNEFYAQNYSLLSQKGCVHLSAASDGDILVEFNRLLRDYQNVKGEFSASRKSLKINDHDLGRFKGTSNWLDQDDSIKIVLHLGQRGYRVHQE